MCSVFLNKAALKLKFWGLHELDPYTDKYENW